MRTLLLALALILVVGAGCKGAPERPVDKPQVAPVKTLFTPPPAPIDECEDGT